MGHVSNIRIEIELYGAFTREDADEVLSLMSRLSGGGVKVAEFVVTIDGSIPDITFEDSIEFGHSLGKKLNETGAYAAIIHPNDVLDGHPEYLLIDATIHAEHINIAQFDTRTSAENWLSEKKRA